VLAELADCAQRPCPQLQILLLFWHLGACCPVCDKASTRSLPAASSRTQIAVFHPTALLY
jgi:hypothetical protein